MIANVLIVFLSVMLLAFGLYKIFKLPSGITPFMAMSIDLCIITMAAYYNLLFVGCAVTCVLSVAVFVYSIVRKGVDADDVKCFFTPGMIMFLLCSAGIIFYFGLRQPVYSTWDEFSFWGTAHKLTKINNSIYTFYESSMIGVTTPATLALLSYFFQFFADGFAPFVAYIAYDVLFFAAFCAIVSRFDWDNFAVAFFGYTSAFFSLYFFRMYAMVEHVVPIYMDSLADTPLSVICAGCFAIYMSTDDKLKGTLCMLPSIFMLTGVKDMGFALSSILAFLVLSELLLYKGDVHIGKVKGFFVKLSMPVMIEATTVSAFAAWTIHMSRVMSVNRFELGGESNMGMAEMMIVGIKQLFSKEPIEKFAIIKQSMITAFFQFKICILGSGLVAVMIISAIFFLCIVLADKEDRLRIVLLYIASFISYVAYYIFHLFLYVFIFKDNGYGLEAYSRYFSSIYNFWLLLAIIVLLYTCYKGKFRRLAKVAIAGCAVILTALPLYLSGPQTSFYNYHTLGFENERLLSAKADTIRDVIQPEDRMYLFVIPDSGLKWFIYTYELAENVIYRDMPEMNWYLTDPDERAQMKKDFAEYLKKHEITHLVVDSTYPEFEDFFHDNIDWDEVGDIGQFELAYFKIIYQDDHADFQLVKKGAIDEKAI